MADVKKINGYDIKDATARTGIANIGNTLGNIVLRIGDINEEITEVGNKALEGYDASWIMTGIQETAVNFKNLYDAVLFNISDNTGEDYANKKYVVFIKKNDSIITCVTEELITLTQGSDFDTSSYQITLITSELVNGSQYNVKYVVTKNTDNSVIVTTDQYSPDYNRPEILYGDVTAQEATILGKQLPYPSGYTKDNTIIISQQVSYDNGATWGNPPISTVEGSSGTELFVRLTSNYIILNNQMAFVNETGYAYKIVIMKQ